jgi:hypothetical protein
VCTLCGPRELSLCQKRSRNLNLPKRRSSKELVSHQNFSVESLSKFLSIYLLWVEAK